MEDKKEQGIFIPFDIWTIKDLNINEKLILSDIHNKELYSERKEYNVKAETLKDILYLDIFTIKNIFNSLQKKGYIASNSEIYRNQGKFKKGLPRRYIKQDNFLNAKRFIIPNDNIFLRNGENGIFFNNNDLYFLNAWSRTIENFDNEKIKLRAKTTNKHLILFLIIKKISFFHGETYKNIFARFTIKDIVEFTGIGRKTIGIYIKTFTNTSLYNQKKIRLLYDLNNEHIYNELYNKLGDLSVLTDYRKNSKEFEVKTIYGNTETISIGNMENLYYINMEDMELVGMNVVNLLKDKK